MRIFQVAYDDSLLCVRTEMLKHAGFHVSSALGNAQARRELETNADYGLVVVGWSALDAERAAMVQWVKAHYPHLKLIALYHDSGQQIAEADFNSRSENPEEWFGPSSVPPQRTLLGRRLRPLLRVFQHPHHREREN